MISRAVCALLSSPVSALAMFLSGHVSGTVEWGTLERRFLPVCPLPKTHLLLAGLCRALWC